MFNLNKADFLFLTQKRANLFLQLKNKTQMQDFLFRLFFFSKCPVLSADGVAGCLDLNFRVVFKSLEAHSHRSRIRLELTKPIAIEMDVNSSTQFGTNSNLSPV